MRIAVVGGGPAGLYFAYRWKKHHPENQLDLFEQNAANATWGFGVVFSNRAWEFLRSDDSETADFLSPQMEIWNNITLHHPDASVEIDGVGFSASPHAVAGSCSRSRRQASFRDPDHDDGSTCRL